MCVTVCVLFAYIICLLLLFMVVSDLVSGLISLMESNVTEPVNLGNPEEHTMREFANIIQSLTGQFSRTETST